MILWYILIWISMIWHVDKSLDLIIGRSSRLLIALAMKSFSAAKLLRSPTLSHEIYMTRGSHVSGIGPEGRGLRHLPSRSEWVNLCLFVFILTARTSFTNISILSHWNHTLSQHLVREIYLVEIATVGSHHASLSSKSSTDCLLRRQSCHAFQASTFRMIINFFMSNGERKFDLDVNVLNQPPQQIEFGEHLSQLSRYWGENEYSNHLILNQLLLSMTQQGA